MYSPVIGWRHLKIDSFAEKTNVKASFSLMPAARARRFIRTTDKVSEVLRLRLRHDGLGIDAERVDVGRERHGRRHEIVRMSNRTGGAIRPARSTAGGTANLATLKAVVERRQSLHCAVSTRPELQLASRYCTLQARWKSDLCHLRWQRVLEQQTDLVRASS